MMEQVILNALKHRLEKKAGFVGDELNTAWQAGKGAAKTTAAPLWLANRTLNPMYAMNTVGKSAQGAAKGAKIGGGVGAVAGAGLGGYGGYKLGKKMGYNTGGKLLAALLGAGVGGVAGGAAGAGVGAGVGGTYSAIKHNPLSSYKV